MIKGHNMMFGRYVLTQRCMSIIIALRGNRSVTLLLITQKLPASWLMILTPYMIHCVTNHFFIDFFRFL